MSFHIVNEGGAWSHTMLVLDDRKNDILSHLDRLEVVPVMSHMPDKRGVIRFSVLFFELPPY